jgi:hypothetical protein
MRRVVGAELGRLLRPRTVVALASACVAFAVVASLAVLTSARESGPAVSRGSTTVARLESAAGATEAFAVGASFLGFFVFDVHRSRRQ